MKLKKFNEENTPRTRRCDPTIRFVRKTGLISISAEAGRILGMNSGDARLEFFQNEEVPKDWYISLTHDQQGFQFRSKGRLYLLNSVSMSRNILDSLKTDRPGLASGEIDITKGATFRISTTPVLQGEKKLYYIITGKPLK
ncbi:MAG: hypothetical protein WC914_00200 [Proteiniphilum sp.]